MAICDYCHKSKPDVEECYDPFRAEVYNEKVEVDICRECYQRRVEDI